eukprot:scaffold265327_cov31-Tisochrysis_lutea.AAC.3
MRTDPLHSKCRSKRPVVEPPSRRSIIPAFGGCIALKKDPAPCATIAKPSPFARLRTATPPVLFALAKSSALWLVCPRGSSVPLCRIAPWGVRGAADRPQGVSGGVRGLLRARRRVSSSFASTRVCEALSRPASTKAPFARRLRSSGKRRRIRIRCADSAPISGRSSLGNPSISGGLFIARLRACRPS